MKKCICCNNETTLTIRINEFDGFCHSSESKPVCGNCFEKNIKETNVGDFLIVKDSLYYCRSRFIGSAYEKVRGEKHLKMIFNPDYYELLQYV